MRVIMMLAAVAAVGACNRGDAGNNIASTAGNKAATGSVEAHATGNAVNPAAANSAAPSSASAGALPQGFPDSDRDARAAECYVYLGLSREARSRNTGYDDVAMNQAQDQWRSDLRLRMTEEETNQLIGSSVNPLMSTPAPQRDAASNWCVQNAAEPDPDRR